MGSKRMDGYPEMAMVRRFLQAYVDRFDNNVLAAKKIGTTGSTLGKWLNGVEPIPEWLCEHLGFRKEWIYIGMATLSTTELAQKCMTNESRRDRRVSQEAAV